MKSFTLVAHRGYPKCYPENTMVGFRAAVEAGATWLETDIQFSRDGEPVLYHDGTLERTSGHEGSPWDYDTQRLQGIGASERKRFGDRFTGEPIPTLDEFVKWAIEVSASHGDLQLFIELKEESLQCQSNQASVDVVMHRLDPLLEQCMIISKNIDYLTLARQWVDGTGSENQVRIGWVLPDWTEHSRQRALYLDPDMLICDVRRFPRSSALWAGAWKWMAYTIDDPHLAIATVARGVPFVETDDIGAMIKNERLKGLAR